MCNKSQRWKRRSQRLVVRWNPQTCHRQRRVSSLPATLIPLAFAALPDWGVLIPLAFAALPDWGVGTAMKRGPTRRTIRSRVITTLQCSTQTTAHAPNVHRFFSRPFLRWRALVCCRPWSPKPPPPHRKALPFCRFVHVLLLPPPSPHPPHLLLLLQAAQLWRLQGLERATHWGQCPATPRSRHARFFLARKSVC